MDADLNVVIRTDGSLTIGSGHVMRCLTLATALKSRCGANVSFVIRDEAGGACDLVESRGFPVWRLHAGSPGAGTSAGSDSPSLAWSEDAAATRAVIESLPLRPEWIVVDHYHLDRQWERQLRPLGEHLMVIDDLADRLHECDVLVDQNLVAEMDTRYSGKVPDACTTLLGPSFALLQAEYGRLHEVTPARSGPVRRLFVFMSGGDASNLTGRVLRAFLSLDHADVEVDVAIGASSPHADAIHRDAAGCANVHVHVGVPTLAFLMARADLAVGAAGATSWERLCLGLPTVVVTMAGHQKPIAAELERRGLIQWLGHYDEVSEARLTLALRRLLSDGLDLEWSLRCRRLIDGRGTGRVCDAIVRQKRRPRGT